MQLYDYLINTKEFTPIDKNTIYTKFNGIEQLVNAFISNNIHFLFLAKDKDTNSIHEDIYCVYSDTERFYSKLTLVSEDNKSLLLLLNNDAIQEPISGDLIDDLRL